MIEVLENGHLAVAISSLGAELQSLRDLRTGTEHLWRGDARWWGRRSPVLFPIVGRLRDDRYLLNGREYRMGQHGFARDREFSLEKRSPESLRFALRSDDATRALYHFDFELGIRYELDGARLAVTYEVVDPGPTPLPFCIGAHPGFACPFRPGESLEDYRLRFALPERTQRHFLDGGLLSEETEPFLKDQAVLPLDGTLFARDAIVLKGLESSWVTLERRDGAGPRLVVEFGGWPHLGIWTKPSAPFLCIEPWQGLADAAGTDGDFFQKEGLVSLAPGEFFRRSWAVAIEL